MPAQLNHTIVWSSNQTKSAHLLTTILALPAPIKFGHFDVVKLDNETALDFAYMKKPIHSQHYAFLIDEADFEAVLGRVQERCISFWADPMRRRPGEINYENGGRGIYFADLDGHLLEVITRPYRE